MGNFEKKLILEACVENISNALAAQSAGANRIELCENLEVGGITPSYGTIKIANSVLKIPILVMIRPRGGNFIYSEMEMNCMMDDIQICKELRVPGVVFGVLNTENQIDFEATKILVECAKPLSITFHKAFDLIEDWKIAIDQLIELKIDRILTSGGKKTAEEGTERLNEMIEYAAGRIKFVAAGKVSKENIDLLAHNIKTNEFHGKKIV